MPASGWVRDTKGNPVPGRLFISLSYELAQQEQSGILSGVFSTSFYNLTFQAVGFEKRVLKVSIIEDHYEELNIELQEGCFISPRSAFIQEERTLPTP